MWFMCSQVDEALPCYIMVPTIFEIVLTTEMGMETISFFHSKDEVLSSSLLTIPHTCPHTYLTHTHPAAWPGWEGRKEGRKALQSSVAFKEQSSFAFYFFIYKSDKSWVYEF
jgi:hypothetical protein